MRPIEAYLQRLAAGLSALSASEREECLREVRAHLEEAAALSAAESADARETEAIARFGPADAIARSLSNELLLGVAAEGLRPVSTGRALLHALVSGAGWTAIGVVASLVYVALLLIGVVSIARLWIPEAGLWIHPDGSWSLSFGAFDHAVEAFGPWLPLYGPLLTLAGWMAINAVLKRVLRVIARRRRAPEALEINSGLGERRSAGN